VISRTPWPSYDGRGGKKDTSIWWSTFDGAGFGLPHLFKKEATGLPPTLAVRGHELFVAWRVKWSRILNFARVPR